MARRVVKLDRPIDLSWFTEGHQHRFSYLGVASYRDLVENWTVSDLLRAPNCGKSFVKAVAAHLGELGLSLRGYIEETHASMRRRVIDNLMIGVRPEYRYGRE